MSQHMDALAHGNELRLARAEIKRQIKDGKTAVSDVLTLTPLPECLSTMLPEALLTTAFRFQSKMAHQFLSELPVSLTRRLGEMTYRQRVKLAEKVRDWELSRPSERRARPHVNSIGSGGRAA